MTLIENKTIVETERLLLRQFVPQDAPFLYLLNSDPEVIQYTGDPPFASVSKAEEFIINYENYYQDHKIGRWLVVLKDSREPLGWCGLKRDEVGFVDIGYRFLKLHWGKGYATEAAMACLNYGFEVLLLKEIIGRVAFENVASINVLTKIGLKYWKQGGCGSLANALYYKVSVEEFRNFLDSDTNHSDS